jgi:hypothetical protein
MRRPVIAAAAVSALVAAVVPALAHSAPPSLKFGPNTFAYAQNYGEPGLAIYKHTVYATTPGDGGAVLAKSTDDGRHWKQLPTVKPDSQSPGQFTSGGDSDVVVGPDGTVFVGDLEIDGISVFRSTNGGKTFSKGTSRARPTVSGSLSTARTRRTSTSPGTSSPPARSWWRRRTTAGRRSALHIRSTRSR